VSPLYENRVTVCEFDERMLEILVEGDIEVGWACAGCGKSVAKMCEFQGELVKNLDCPAILIVDGKHYRPICQDCYASFQAPRSTASRLFGL
jgi:hypothetical protein